MSAKVTINTFEYVHDESILKDVKFEVKNTEIFGIVGASGCGKTTLLKLLGGILPEQSGHKFIGNLLVSGKSPFAPNRWTRIGYVFQDYKLLPFLTVREQLEWVANRGGSEKKRLIESISPLLETVGLTGSQNLYPKHLSGGMKARVALARALIGQPEILLIDEGFSSLDIGWRTKLFEEIRQIRERLNLTIIIVSHSLRDVCLLADRILVLSSSGRMVGIYDAANGDDPRLEKLIEEKILSDHSEVMGLKP